MTYRALNTAIDAGAFDRMIEWWRPQRGQSGTGHASTTMVFAGQDAAHRVYRQSTEGDQKGVVIAVSGDEWIAHYHPEVTAGWEIREGGQRHRVEGPVQVIGRYQQMKVMTTMIE